MTKPKYRTRTHKGLRARYAAEVAAGRGWCMEAECLEPTRYIEPSAAWDLAHTPDGRAYLGPAHARCNRAEGARRGNALRTAKPKRRRVL